MVSLKVVFNTASNKEYDITINNYNEALSEAETVAELQKIVTSGCVSPGSLISSIVKADIIKVTESEITI